MPLDGLKNYLAAAITAILNAVVAFGAPLTEEQKLSVLGLVNTFLVPVVWVWLRRVTTGPAASIREMFGMHGPKLMPILLLITVGGCASMAPSRAPQDFAETAYMTAAAGAGLTAQVNDMVCAPPALPGCVPVISKDQHKQAIGKLDEIFESVSMAIGAYNASNYSQAETLVDKADAVLRSVAVWVAAWVREIEQMPDVPEGASL